MILAEIPWGILALVLPGFLIGLTLHEFAHAWMAWRLGDGFARRQGRLSLNPFKHLSLLGTLAIVFVHFGWAKPVPINAYNFRRPKRDFLLTSLAGPAMNLLIAAAALGLMHLTRHSFAFEAQWATVALTIAHLALLFTVVSNLILAAINLLPVPPLDGSRIWPVLVPQLRVARQDKASGLFVIVLIVLLWSGSLDSLFGRVINAAHWLTPPSDFMAFQHEMDQGDLAFVRKRYPRAEKHYTNALALYSQSNQALYRRADVRYRQEHYQQALADVGHALELSPDNPAYLDLSADCHEALGHKDRARQLRAQAAKARGTPPTTGPAEDQSQRRNPLPNNDLNTLEPNGRWVNGP